MKYDLEELMKENMNIRETPSKELHERILECERGETKMKNKKKYGKYVPRAAAAALAAIIVTSGITYAATNFWDHFTAEDFGVADDSAMMKDLNEKGFAKQPQAAAQKENPGSQTSPLSVTDQDITVTVLQTLADEHSAYVSFEVKYGDQYHAVDEEMLNVDNYDFGVAYPYPVTFQMDSGITLNYCGNSGKIKDEHTVIYNYCLTTSESKDTFRDGKISMSMSAFYMDHEKCDPNPAVIAENGNWDLSWDLSVGTEKRIYHLDRALALGEDTVIAKDLTVTPLSAELTLQNPDGVSLNGIAAVVEETPGRLNLKMDENRNLEVIRYIRTGGMENEDKIEAKLPEGQMLHPLDNFDLCLEDSDFDGMGGMGYLSPNEQYAQFDKVLDLEQLAGVRVAGKYIDLKDVSYDTVR